MANKLQNIDGFRDVQSPNTSEGIDQDISKRRAISRSLYLSNETPLPKRLQAWIGKSALDQHGATLRDARQAYLALLQTLEKECNTADAAEILRKRREACINDETLPIVTASLEDVRRELQVTAEIHWARFRKNVMPRYLDAVHQVAIAFEADLRATIQPQLDYDAEAAAELGLEPGAPSYWVLCLNNVRTRIRNEIPKIAALKERAGRDPKDHEMIVDLSLLDLLGVK